MKMKSKIKKLLVLAFAASGTIASVFAAESIACVADPVTGVYCGTGYKISVSVSKPATDATVELSETGTEGTWVAADSFAGYTDVCTEKAMHYRVSATGYATATGTANVTVTPKALTEDYVWGVYPAEAYVYDGTEKKPDAACGDGEPSIITEDDFTVSYANNVNAGEDTAKIIFTGKGNYTGTVEETFSIAKADAWGSGGEPGSGVVPPGGVSKFDTTVEYDGQKHTIDTNALESVTKTGFALTFSYALTKDGEYQSRAFTYTDVVVTSCWYKISLNNENYIKSLALKSLSLSPSSVRLTVSAATVKEWNGVNPSALRVSYRASLADEPVMLTPTSAVQNNDGTVTLEVATPEGSSGFFQTVLEK